MEEEAEEEEERRGRGERKKKKSGKVRDLRGLYQFKKKLTGELGLGSDGRLRAHHFGSLCGRGEEAGEEHQREEEERGQFRHCFWFRFKKKQ